MGTVSSELAEMPQRPELRLGSEQTVEVQHLHYREQHSPGCIVVQPLRPGDEERVLSGWKNSDLTSPLNVTPARDLDRLISRL